MVSLLDRQLGEMRAGENGEIVSRLLQNAHDLVDLLVSFGPLFMSGLPIVLIKDQPLAAYCCALIGLVLQAYGNLWLFDRVREK